MKRTPVLFSALITLAIISNCAIAGDDADMDRGHPKAFVKDSAITAKIKAQLANAHVSSVGHIHVDTDASGVVWLTGTARSQSDIDQAVSIAKNTAHVVTVKSDLTVKKDD